MELIGKNIQTLRKLNKESQKELASNLGFVQHTISNYEKGEREPDIEKIQMLANYFQVPLEIFVGCDLANFDLSNLVLNSKTIKEFFDVMFPVVCSEEALGDSYFRRGYDCLVQIKNTLLNNKSISAESIRLCRKHFMLSWKMCKREEVAANLLCLQLIIFISIIESEEIEDAKKLEEIDEKENNITKIINTDAYQDFIRKRYLQNFKNSVDLNSSRKEFVQENDESVMEYIRILKRSPKWSELGDYFFSLRYRLGMIDNGNSQAFNMELGDELMSSLFELDNQYALEFIAKELVIYGYVIKKYHSL